MASFQIPSNLVLGDSTALPSFRYGNLKKNAITRSFTSLNSAAGQYYEFATPVVLTGDFEIEMDFMYDDTILAGQRLLKSLNEDFVLYVNSSANERTLVFKSRNLSTSAYAFSTYTGQVPSPDTLHNLTFKRSGNDYIMTLDGISATKTLATEFFPLAIAHLSASATAFDGVIANFKVWTEGDRNTGTLVVDMPLDENWSTSKIARNKAIPLGSNNWGNSANQVTGGWVNNFDGTYTKASSATAGNVGEIYNIDTTVLPNTTYVMEFTINAIESTLNIFTRNAGVNTLIVESLSTGTHKLLLKTGNEGGLWFARNPFVGTISNVTIKEATNYATAVNITNTDAELFTYSETYTGWLGGEKVINGSLSSDTDWFKGTGWSISDGIANALNISNTSYFRPTINIGMSVGHKYVFSIDIVSVIDGSFQIAIFDGASGSSPVYATTGNKKWTYTAPRFDDQFVFRALPTVFTGSIDNVSVKRLIEVA